jgi:UDP-N-acetylglucosamine 1-carboxyvinyltransferase
VPVSLLIQKSRLTGKVTLSGAKNSVLRLLAASLLTNEKIVLYNYPAGLSDATIHVKMLQYLGKKIQVNRKSIVIEQPSSLSSSLVWKDRSIRNTLLILGALVTITGYGSVPLPGGCNLGDRQYDLHGLVLQSLGAKVWNDNGTLYAEAPRGLIGADIKLPIRSTGATENAIIAGSLANGITRIWNPHIRPEIIDLINFLKSMGAMIKVFGQEHIEVTGVDGLAGTSHTVMPDNMEAITWLVAAVMTGGDIEIQQFPIRDLEVPMIHLRESGAKFYTGDDTLIVRGGRCYPLDISTGPFPGINSDVQPIFAAYASCANGESRIIDLRFPGRYGYAKEMAKMGVNFSNKNNLLRIQGNCGKLTGAKVKALDLRAGAALALCGLVAEGDTLIEDAWQIERGYDDFVNKLKQLQGLCKEID